MIDMSNDSEISNMILVHKIHTFFYMQTFATQG